MIILSHLLSCGVNMKKVLIGLSGGIDSSVAAYLLKSAGYEVEGVTMLIWKKDSPYPAPVSPNSCYNPDKEKDLEEIDRIARKIGIPHRVIDCSALYESKVLDNFKAEYMNARTPNPCIWCNALIKFGAMVDEAHRVVDFDYFATGHYARIARIGERYAIRKAADGKKDQSYFLSRLSQKQLESTLFPLGELSKEEVRRLDVSLGLHPEGQSESQDFYGGDYADLLCRNDEKGDIVFRDGKKLGEHNGFWHYTIGQRKGLGIAYSEPLYVIALDPVKNLVIVGLREDTMMRSAICGDVNFMASDTLCGEKEYSIKIRSTSPGASGKATILPDGNLRIDFMADVNAITPGQSAVIYDGDIICASAIIDRVI